MPGDKGNPWSTLRPVHAAAALLLSAMPVMLACPTECVGASCDDDVLGARLAVHAGGRALAGTLDQAPSEGALEVRGSAIHGPDWALTFAPGGLAVGMPQLGQVRLLDTTPRREAVIADTPGLTFGSLFGEGEGDRFGASIAATQLEDGRTVWWVGAPGLQGGGLEPEAGAVYLFVDPDLDADRPFPASEATIRVLSEAAYDRLGERVVACGDTDGDGLPEHLATASWDETGAGALGSRVYVMQSAEWDSLGSQTLAGQLGLSFWSSGSSGREAAQLGRALSCTEDFDGDGLADYLMGAPFAGSGPTDAVGKVYLIPSGNSLRPSTAGQAASVVLQGLAPGWWFGSALAAGDLDGDGLPDLAVGAPGGESGRGVVTLHNGADLRARSTRISVRIIGDEPQDHFGASVAIADPDGDGHLDLIVGAPRFNPTASDSDFASGGVWIFRGPFDLEADRIRSPTDADASLIEPGQYLKVGDTIATGDADGDGADELAITLGASL